MLKAGFEASKFIISQIPWLDTVILCQFYMGIYVGWPSLPGCMCAIHHHYQTAFRGLGYQILHKLRYSSTCSLHIGTCHQKNKKHDCLNPKLWIDSEIGWWVPIVGMTWQTPLFLLCGAPGCKNIFRNNTTLSPVSSVSILFLPRFLLACKINFCCRLKPSSLHFLLAELDPCIPAQCTKETQPLVGWAEMSRTLQKTKKKKKTEVHFHLLQKEWYKSIARSASSATKFTYCGNSAIKKLCPRSKAPEQCLDFPPFMKCSTHRLVSCHPRKSAVFGYFAAEIN